MSFGTSSPDAASLKSNLDTCQRRQTSGHLEHKLDTAFLPLRLTRRLPVIEWIKNLRIEKWHYKEVRQPIHFFYLINYNCGVTPNTTMVGSDERPGSGVGGDVYHSNLADNWIPLHRGNQAPLRSSHQYTTPRTGMQKRC